MNSKFFNLKKFIFGTFILFSSFQSINCLADVSYSDKNYSESSISDYCDDSLEWYDDHPGYSGEFTRVLDYCIEYVKDVSPEGFNVNPILSDFGAMNGVNTRPRDNIHQGIDIIGRANQPILAISDGMVLETTIEDCWGGTVIVDHGKAFDGKNMIAIYGHVGEFLVNENDKIKRGDMIARLPSKIEYRCMARVRHLHLQIGQRYCKKEEKDNWGCKYFIKDFYRSLNPHDYWADGVNNVSCFNDEKSFKNGTITYPFKCKKLSKKNN